MNLNSPRYFCFSLYCLCIAFFSLYGCAKPIVPDAHNQEPSLELSVKDPRGPWVHVGDLHGQVVVLLLLGTFDTISQAELVPFERIAIRRPDIAFVGVLAQPGAAQFADAFVNALSPTFPMGYDPDNQLMQGRTLLGPITTIPTIIVLDRSGHIVVRKEGFVSERLLEQSIDEAQSREPTEATTSPPLLGGSIHQPN